jgi:hypothetical protein
VLRHTAFFMLKEGNGPEEMKWMQKGSAYMRFTAAGPVAIDFGSDVFGGSLRLSETKPWERVPRWRAATAGPPCDYDVALHLDFDDEAGLAAYNEDDVHHEIAAYNASVCQGELTARIDWWYDEAPLIAPGHVRHTAMFIWKDGVDETSKERTLAEVKRLVDEPGVERLTIGTGVGGLKTDYDWIVDLQLPHADAIERLRNSDGYGDVMRGLSAVTKYEWTARLSHTMHGH